MNNNVEVAINYHVKVGVLNKGTRCGCMGGSDEPSAATRGGAPAPGRPNGLYCM